MLIESLLKRGKELIPQKNKSYELYLDQSLESSLVGKITTNEEGKAKLFLPVNLQTMWNAKPQHTFILKEKDEEIISDYSITKSKLIIDTLINDGVKNIKVTVLKANENSWVPVQDAELKVGYKRLGGILPAGDEATYTTDSTGAVLLEVKKDSMPGDQQGNVMLTASLEDHDLLGNATVEKQVAWGKPTTLDNSFFEKRTLWTTRFRTPFWLLVPAYALIIGVWGTLIYLFAQLLKLIKIGKSGK